TNIKPQRRGEVDYIGWVDGAFLCGRAYFDALGWAVPKTRSKRGETSPDRGSGVGAAISHKLVTKKLEMFRVVDSLLTHVHSISVMNPAIRLYQPFF
ncbi:hypothetical protein LCGC14_1049950, partial [marine sediment metagenome]